MCVNLDQTGIAFEVTQPSDQNTSPTFWLKKLGFQFIFKKDELLVKESGKENKLSILLIKPEKQTAKVGLCLTKDNQGQYMMCTSSKNIANPINVVEFLTKNECN